MERRTRSSKALCAFGVILAAACLSGGPVRAEEIPASIREVMQIDSDVWSPRQPKRSLFSDDTIARLFSRNFAWLYGAAMKHAIYPDGKTPFDFGIGGRLVIDGLLTSEAEYDDSTRTPMANIVAGPSEWLYEPR